MCMQAFLPHSATWGHGASVQSDPPSLRSDPLSLRSDPPLIALS